MTRGRMPLAEAAARGPTLPAIYTLLRGGVPLYVGQSANLRSRMQGYAWYIERLRCGALSEYSVSFVPASGSADPRRLQLERRHMGRVAQILRRRGLPDLTNVQRESSW